jgi:hypothetical protein
MYPSTYLIATFPYKTIYYFETANNDLVFVKHHVYSASFAVHFKLRPTLYSRAYQVNYSHFQQYFSYILAVSFIGGGNWRTWKKTPICRKSLADFPVSF